MSVAVNKLLTLVVEDTQTEEWREQIYDDPARVFGDLLEAGVPAETAESLDAELRIAIADETRESFKHRLQEIFGTRRLDCVDKTTVRVEVPLFLLAAPGVPDSAVEYEVETSDTFELGWTVTIFGTGIGPKGTVTLTDTGTFTSEGTERQMVFLPVSLDVEKISYIEHNKKVGEGFRTTPLLSTGQVHHSEGLRMIESEPEGPLTAFGARDEFPLHDAVSGSKAQFKRKLDGTLSGGLEIGFKAFGCDFSVKASATRARSHTLTYTLPGGHLYACERIRGPHLADGLRWIVG